VFSVRYRGLSLIPPCLRQEKTLPQISDNYGRIIVCRTENNYYGTKTFVNSVRNLCTISLKYLKFIKSFRTSFLLVITFHLLRSHTNEWPQ
jgi:hypothetical protein